MWALRPTCLCATRLRNGLLPGPRILTAVEPLTGRGPETGTPDEIRAFIRKQKEAGADLIKIFALASIRQGGGMTLSQEQLNAACDEAKKLGLRTLVHAYKDAVRAAPWQAVPRLSMARSRLMMI